MTRLSAVIIVKNAELTLPATITSLGFCDEVIVLDSGSSDRSREIAQMLGAQVSERTFDNFAAQKNYAISLASGDWVLSIDSDEVVIADLAREIRAVIERPEAAGAAFRVRRRTTFLGKVLRFGGHQSDRPIRIFAKGSGRFVGEVHETFEAAGKIEQLKSVLLHHSTATVKEYLRKLNHYTDLEVKQVEVSAALPTRTKVVLKPLARFAQKYLIELGFADGQIGLVYAVLSGYYELIRQAKLWQKSKNYSANI